MKKVVLSIGFVLLASNVFAGGVVKDLSKKAYTIVPTVDVHVELSDWRSDPKDTIPTVQVNNANMTDKKMFDEVINAAKPYSTLIAFDQISTLKLTCQDLGVKKHNSTQYRCLKDNGQNGGWAEGVGAWVDGSGRPFYYNGQGNARLHVSMFCFCTDEKISNLPVDSEQDQIAAQAKYDELEKSGASEEVLDAVATSFDKWFSSIPQYSFEGRMGMSKLKVYE